MPVPLIAARPVNHAVDQAETGIRRGGRLKLVGEVLKRLRNAEINSAQLQTPARMQSSRSRSCCAALRSVFLGGLCALARNIMRLRPTNRQPASLPHSTI